MTTTPTSTEARTIHRHEIPADGEWHDLQLNGAILHVDARTPYTVEVWALESRGPNLTRTFCVMGTGQTMPDDGEHIGTAIIPGGQFVWHLLERCSPEKGKSGICTATMTPPEGHLGAGTVDQCVLSAGHYVDDFDAPDGPHRNTLVPSDATGLTRHWTDWTEGATPHRDADTSSQIPGANA